MNWGYLVDFAVVAVCGAAVGLGEIVSRYKDEPGAVLISRPAILYLFVNGLLSASALGFIYIYSWSGTPEAVAPSTPTVVNADPKPAGPTGVKKVEAGDTLASRCTRVLLAGFAAMAFFRSALFTLRISGQDVGVGPVMFFQSILTAIDSNVDRLRGTSRINRATTTMQGVDFAKAVAILTPVCVNLLQNASQDDVARLTKVVAEISQNASTTNDARSLLLGLALMNLVGEKLLQEAVTNLRPMIKSP